MRKLLKIGYKHIADVIRQESRNYATALAIAKRQSKHATNRKTNGIEATFRSMANRIRSSCISHDLFAFVQDFGNFGEILHHAPSLTDQEKLLRVCG